MVWRPFGISFIIICSPESNCYFPLIRSATSIGANYLEANNASSKKDFTNKIFICKKESEETKYWLKILFPCYPNEKELLGGLYDECRQLNLIFQKIVSTIRNGK